MQIIKILIVLFAFPSCLSAQQTREVSIDSIAGDLTNTIRQHAVEQVLLTTDKQAYAAGEALWFKAFVINSINDELIKKSKILYADLVNEKDSVIARLILNAGDLQTSGRITLDNNLPTGFYWLRAYTKQLLAEDTNNIGIKPVYIQSDINRNIKKNYITQVADTGKNSQPVIDVFPEGGQLISGTDCIVALKAHNKQGQPLKVSGIIKDSQNVIVAKFSTNDNGLGKFSFSPKWYGMYSVYVQHDDVFEFAAGIPVVSLYAAQLSVQEQNSQVIKARIMLEDSIYSKTYTTYIIGLHNDSICFAGIGHGMYELNIPVANFPGGIANLLLFNKQGKLVSDRDVYIDKNDINVAVSTDKQNYEARDNVKMNINVTGAGGKPLLAGLAVSVTDMSMAGPPGNFVGDVFKNVQPDDRDLEMLVRKTVTGNELTVQKISAQYDTSLTLGGTIINKNNAGIPAMQVTLLSTKGTELVIQDTTDAAGKFLFELPDLSDSTKCSLQVTDMKGKEVTCNIVTDPPAFPLFHTPTELKKKFRGEQAKLLDTIARNHIDTKLFDLHSHWLTPVEVKTSKNGSDDSREQSRNIITQEMLLENHYSNVAMGVLANGKFRMLGGYLIAGGPNTQYGPQPSDEPMIVVDGQPIKVSSDGANSSPVLSYLNTLFTSEVSYIKVLSGTDAAMYGMRGGNGVIEIYSAKSNGYISQGNTLKDFYIRGFASNDFQMPDYTKRQIKNEKAADIRTTIYWNGNIITDGNGNVSINFFTADEPAVYLVTVTGITANGSKIFKTTTIRRN